jgi:rhamnogalacturonan acetylesterase
MYFDRKYNSSSESNSFLSRPLTGKSKVFITMRLPIVPCFLCALLFAGGALAQAQTAATPATKSSLEPPVTPDQVTRAHDEPLNPALPTLFIVGDSTARNQADLGWGDHFAHYFDRSRVNIANRAIAGRSSRTYMREGAWAKTLGEMKAGDTLLLQMGHNDGGALDGAKPRGTLKGNGEETREVTLLSGEKETVHTYGWYLRKYIADARAKGVTTILLTPTVRNIWTDGADGKKHIERDMGYGAVMRAVAASEHIALLDMASSEADLLESFGPEKTAALFPKDHTHTSAVGAELNASVVARRIVADHAPIQKFLLAPLPEFTSETSTSK